jgi:2-phospho-L-lactate guanylyltransferase
VTVGIRYAIAAGYERALLVPGDTPILDSGELSSLLARSAEAQIAVVAVPDRHGTGTNALLLRPPDAIAPSFGEGSLERHVAAAQEAGITCSVEPLPSLVLDVDTPEDLEELASRLDQQRGPAPVTRGALRQLYRVRGERVSA